MSLGLWACAGPSTPTPVPTPSPLTTLPPPPASSLPDPPALDRFLPSLRPRFADDLRGMAGATRYDIDLRLDLSRRQVHGREVLRYTNREAVPLAEVYLRLFANYPGCRSRIDIGELWVRGRRVEPQYRVQRTALRIPLEPPLAVGEEVRLELAFTVQVPEAEDCRYADLTYSNGVWALAHIYPQVPVYDDEGWNLELAPPYGDLVYADASLFQVTMTLPLTMVAAASGTEVVRRPNDAGMVTRSWVLGPARDFYLALSTDYITLTRRVGDVLLTSYVHSEGEAGGRRALDYAARSLALYSRFGPYRYRELDLVETSTTAGGIEYPGIVALSGGLYGLEGGAFEVTTVHEVAHQWWYNLVGNDQQDEPWLDEALATYCSVWFFEKIEGKEAGQALQDYFRERYMDLVREGQDAPINLPVAAYDKETYDRAVYAKGALFFLALRQEIGEEALVEVLRRYYERHLYRIATAGGLREVIREVAGKEPTDLYRLWMPALGE